MHILVKLDYPQEDIERIEKIVRDNVSFVALIDGDIFDLFNYLNPLNPLKFRAMGDLNFTGKIASLADGEFNPTRNLEPYRWAAAVMAFFKIAEIDFCFDSSLQEFASKNSTDEARAKFVAFHRVNNINPRFLIDFALGRANSISSSAFECLPHIENPAPTKRFDQKGAYFQINFIFMMKIALLDKEDLSGHEKMMLLIDWMLSDFMFGAPALQFANIYFSPSRFRRMLKNKTIEGIHNAAWDLTLIQEWGKIAISESGTQRPLMLVTRDKAVKAISTRLVASDEEEFRSHMIKPWGVKMKSHGKKIFAHYQSSWDIVADDESRKRPSYALLSRVKADLEQQLFG